MASHSQLSLGPMEGKALSLRRESAAPAEVQEVSLTKLLAGAVEDTGCSEKDAAISQGYPPNYWSRIKSGEKAAHLERLTKLPESVQREFVKRYARQLRMDVREEDAQRAALVDLVESAARALRVIA